MLLSCGTLSLSAPTIVPTMAARSYITWSPCILQACPTHVRRANCYPADFKMPPLCATGRQAGDAVVRPGRVAREVAGGCCVPLVRALQIRNLLHAAMSLVTRCT
jgi:hypothetical protein